MKNKILLFFALLVSASAFSQINPTFKSIKLDSIRTRISGSDTIWLTDNAGSIAYIRVKDDSLIFGDDSGEKYLADLATGGTPGGSPGDIQYNNAGSFGGMNVSTDGNYMQFGASGTNVDSSKVTTVQLVAKNPTDSITIDSLIKLYTSGNLRLQTTEDGYLYQNDGNFNNVLGYNSLQSNTTGDRNIAIGYSSMQSNTEGDRNVSIGIVNMFQNTTGSYNVAVGGDNMTANTTGSYNTAIGRAAMDANTTGSNNIALGYTAGENNTILNNRLFIHSLGTNVSINDDSTKSIIYGYQNSVPSLQELYFNADVNIGYTLDADTARILEIDSDTITALKGKFDTIELANGAQITDTISLKSAVESEVFNKLYFEPHDTTDYIEGSIFYSDVRKNFIFKNNITDYTADINRELNIRFYNATGDALTSGGLIRSVGTYITTEGDTIFQGGYAGNGSKDSLINLAVVTSETAIGGLGECTIFGDVREIHHGLSTNIPVYVGNKGLWTTTQPTPPELSQVIGFTKGDYAITFFTLGSSDYSRNPTHAGDTSGITEVVAIGTAGTYEYLPVGTAPDRVDIGFEEAGDSLQILVAGDYNIYLSMSWSGGSADNWRYGIFVNDTLQYYQVTKTSSADVVGDALVISRYLEIGDWVSFRITNTTDADDPTIRTISYSLTYTD